MSRSDAEWDEHLEFVKQALDGTEPTTVAFKDDLGIWDEDRLNQQQDLIDDLWNAASSVPRAGDAVIAGGMAGAGKGTVLKQKAEIAEDDYLTINPDDIKEVMAERGMIPPIPGLSPMEASPLVHEEASELAKRLAAMAYQEQVNVVWDITMSSSQSVRVRIEWLRDADYAAIDAVFVDVPLDEGARRAKKRYRDAQTEFEETGKRNGGRYVPEHFIRESKALVARYSTRNQQVFYEVRDEFDSTVEYDNSGSEAVIRGFTGARWARSA